MAFRRKKESTPEGAYRSALNTLGRADCTEKRLKEKLTERGYSDGDAEQAIGALENEGLLNDERSFARRASYYAEVYRFGRARIRLELEKKGYARDLIDQRLGEAIGEIDFRENCLLFAKKKRLSFPTDEKEKRKVVSSLVRGGYSFSEIRYALDKLKNES